MRYLDKLEEAKVDKGLTRAQKMVAREMRKDDTPDPLAKKNRTLADRRRAVEKLKRDRENPGVARAATLAKNRERAKSLKMQRLANKITGEGDPNEKPEKPEKPGKKLKAEAYIQLGDVLAEAISKAVMSSPSTRKRRLDRRMNVVSGRLQQFTGGDDYKYSRSAEKLTGDSEEMRTSKAKRVAAKLRTSANKAYRDAEVGEASGKDPESVAKEAEKAHRRMKTAHKVEDKS